jgi:hypothetical protein
MARAKTKGTKSGKPISRPRIAAPIKDRIRAAHRAGGASSAHQNLAFAPAPERIRLAHCSFNLKSLILNSRSAHHQIS